MSLDPSPVRSQVPEGARVAYVGEFPSPAEAGLAIGDEGTVISAAGQASHVRWRGGSKRGAITLTKNADLVVTQAEDAITALAHGGQSFKRIAAQAGVEGVFAALESKGYLGQVPLIAEEVANLIAAKVASIPAVAAACDQLDPVQSDALMEATKAAVLQEL